MLFEENEAFIKGTLVFIDEPDWEGLAWSINRLRRSVRDMTVLFERATIDETGAFRVGCDISKYFNERPMFNRFGRPRRQDLDDDVPAPTCDEPEYYERACELADELGADLRDYFLCDFECQVVDPRHITREEREWFARFERDDIASFGRRRSHMEASDLKPLEVKRDEGDPLAELDSLIGLEDVKRQVHQIVDIVSKSSKDKLPCLHMVFTGNPGTGKTTVARLVGRIFDQMGVTAGSGVFEEVCREDLVGMFVGHTAKTTKRAIDQAKGGVLFIDEAYTLGIYADDRNRGFHDYGEEAIATLVKGMEDNRDEFVCIMAGYTDLMKQMIDVNPGLRDRIGFYVDFPDYNAEELVSIFEKQVADDGLALSDGARSAMTRTLADIEAAKDGNFSNGRLVRKIFERVRMKHIVMCESVESPITVAEVEAAFCDNDLAALAEKGAREKSCGFGFTG